MENPTGPSIRINNIIVDIMNTNCMITAGENYQPLWKAHGKSNYGFGKINGLNYVNDQTNIIVDNDVVDHTVYSTD